MLINNKYIIETELGEGSFGKLYKGRHVYTNKLVAIKLHRVDGETMIRNEARILKLLINISGVPLIKAFGKQDGIFYMVVDLLGESVERLNKKYRRRFNSTYDEKVGNNIKCNTRHWCNTQRH